MGLLSKSAAAAAAVAALASAPSARAFNLTVVPRNSSYSYGLALTGDGRGECHEHTYKCSVKRPLCEVRRRGIDQASHSRADRALRMLQAPRTTESGSVQRR
jgi:hypothetical protein